MPAISARFTPPSMTQAQYDEIIRRLEAAGAGNPDGRVYHACYGPDGRLNVFDVWASAETFAAFGQVLFPILEQMGVDPGNPEVLPLHNVIVPTPSVAA